MNFTHLFSIEWDDSYNDPDYAIPGTFMEWISRHDHERERLAKHLEWIAKCIRENLSPFDGYLNAPTGFSQKGEKP